MRIAVTNASTLVHYLHAHKTRSVFIRIGPIWIVGLQIHALDRKTEFSPLKYIL